MIVLRAEAGPTIGGGHVMRCLAIAEALSRAGAKVSFATSAATLASVPRLAAAGLEIVGPDPRPCDVALLDGYAFTVDDEAAWARAGARVAVIEDAPGRRHDCDLLIAPTPDARADYAAWLPSRARILAGPAYAPVDRAFGGLREAAMERRRSSSALRSVLISPGLTDPGGGALKALAALQMLVGIETIVVATGAAALSAMALRAAAAADPRVQLRFDADDMARLTLEADLAIGAAGGSTWERCTLGLPSLVLTAAGNQLPNARALAAADAACVVGPVEAVTAGFIRDMVLALAAQPDRIQRISTAAFGLCDGLGTDRIAAAILDLALKGASGGGTDQA